MTEIVNPEPMDPQMLRMAYTTELLAYGPLIAHLDVEGLVVLRERLRDADLVAICADGNLAEVRKQALDAVCRGLVAGGYAAAQYFLDNGEMFPVVPDDASELDGSV
jgi:hypothetical protein